MSRMAEKAFGDRPVSYPERPGYTEPTTSKAAAKSMEGTAAGLRQRVYRAIHAAGDGGLTPDEAARALDLSVLAVRPRVTELLREGSIVNTPGHTRPNDSGRNAKVWRAK